MVNSFFNMINNTLNFIGTPAGIFILILLALVIVEFLIIVLLIWIIKNQFDKNKKGDSNGTI